MYVFDLGLQIGSKSMCTIQISIDSSFNVLNWPKLTNICDSKIFMNFDRFSPLKLHRLKVHCSMSVLFIRCHALFPCVAEVGIFVNGNHRYENSKYPWIYVYMLKAYWYNADERYVNWNNTCRISFNSCNHDAFHVDERIAVEENIAVAVVVRVLY